MKRFAFIILYTLLAISHLNAQVDFKARVSKTRLSSDERLRVSFTIRSNTTNIKPRHFTPPDFKGFYKIMGPSTSQEVSIINGDVSSSFTYSYILQPAKTGTLTIGPAYVNVGEKRYSTQAVKITVVKGNSEAKNPNNSNYSESSGSPKNNNITVEGKIDKAILVAEVTKTNPYVNEAVGLTYKLYIPRNYGVVNYNETGQPQFNGFWAQDVSKKISGPFQGEVNGKPYIYYVLRKKLLFPQHAGKLTVQPLTLEIDLQVPVYRNFFGMRVPDYEIQRVKLTSGKKTLNVKSLPDNQPIDFSGAVGQFDFKTVINNNQVKTGEPVNISVQVKGTGNLKLFDLPQLKAPEGLEIYDPKHTEQVQTTFQGNRGLVKDDYIVVPNQPGKFIIPGLRFVYFDPKAKQYITKTSGDIVLFVTNSGNNPATGNASNQIITGQTSHAVDFRFIKENARFRSKKKKDFYQSKLFYRLIALAFILALLTFGYYKYSTNKIYDAEYERQKRNKSLANKFLKEAKKSIGNKEEFYAKLEKALHNFIKARLNIDTAEMSKDVIRQKLEGKNIAKENIDLLLDLLNRCDMARYAPATTGKMEDDIADAEKLLNAL